MVRPQDFLQLVSTAGWAVGGEGRRDVQKRRVGSPRRPRKGGWEAAGDRYIERFDRFENQMYGANIGKSWVRGLDPRQRKT